MTAATPSGVLRHVTAFLNETLSNPDLRHSVLSSARRKLLPFSDPTTLQALTLISQTLDSSSSSSSSRSPHHPGKLTAAEKLLLSLPRPNPLSSVLLSFVFFLRRRHVDAALALLDLFVVDPASARNEIAPPVFEDLFIPHLLPAIQWFSDQRSRILLSDSKSRILEEEDDGRSIEAAATMSLLSRMSGGQAEELREMERGYEDVLDENSRVYAEYLKKVLEGSDEGREAMSPPQLVLLRINGGGYNNVKNLFLFSY